MKKNSIYEIFLALLLITLFVIGSFVVVLKGASAYSDAVELHNKEDKYRLSFDYIRNRINEADKVFVNDNKIILDNKNYDIVIYHDEVLKEMMVKDITNVDKLVGEEICDIDNLSINIEDNTITVRIDDREMEVIKR